jgi:hypothetical protein
MRKIFYNGDKAYLVIRSIGEGCLDPEFYGITGSKVGLTPEQVAMQILKLWKEEYRCDHVLRQGKRYLLCQTIKDVEIIE